MQAQVPEHAYAPIPAPQPMCRGKAVRVLEHTPLVLELDNGHIVKAEMQLFGIGVDHRALGFSSIRTATSSLNMIQYSGKLSYLELSDFTDLPLSKEELEQYRILCVNFAVFEKDAYTKCEQQHLLRKQRKDPLADIENRD